MTINRFSSDFIRSYTTVASAIKYKEDNGETGGIYCVEPDGMWSMITLYEKDIYKEIIRREFPEGPDYEANSFGSLSWDPENEAAYILNYFIIIKIMELQILSIMHMIYVPTIQRKK